MTSLPAVFGCALRDAWANRRSFWVQVTLMIANDASWVVFWILFFHRVGTLRGWKVADVLLLFSILLVASGVSCGLVADARRIGRLAADGQLDAVLVLPVPTLGYLLTRRIDTALVGDLLFGPILFAIAGHPTPVRTVLFVCGALLGSLAFVGFLVGCGALTLFLGGRGEQSDLAFQGVLILASYPLDLFGGRTKLLLFTALPAAFVSGLPTRLVRHFEVGTAVELGLAAAGFAIAGTVLFQLGLRRYSSGSVFTRG